MDVSFLRLLVVLLLVVPALTAVVAALLGPQRAKEIRWLSLGAMLLNLLVALVLTFGFLDVRAAHEAPGDRPLQSVVTYQPELVPGATADNPHRTTWQLLPLGNGQVEFYLGIDGMNIWLIDLTALLMVSAVLISWSIAERVHEYFAWLLLLGSAMLGVFLSFDLILFYVFFELTLVPLFFLIGIWGGPERRHAARKFFIYTLTGSLIAFLGLLAVVIVCYDRPLASEPRTLTFAIPELVRLVNTHLQVASSTQAAFWHSFQFWVFFALVAGFAIKVPLFPFHTWLPLAHVEAPTAGSVLLAGVLLKLGTYGFLRLCLPLTPDACLTWGMPLLGTLAVAGILYGAFCALAQDDIKKLVAYSSVSHLGYCMLGLFALNHAGLTGGLLQMVNHGLSTGGLFLIVGMLYERYHTRKIADYGGLAARLKLLSVCMVVICLSSAGLPGLNGFIGEALVFFGMFEVSRTLAIIGTAGILLGAWYLLNILRTVFFGTLQEPQHDEHHKTPDLNGRELAALAPILVLCVWLGLFPQPFIRTADPDVGVVSRILDQRRLVHTTPPATAASGDKVTR